MEVLLTSREVCQLLRISRSRLWHYAKHGYLQPVRVGPNSHPRWRKSDIDALIAAASNKNASAADIHAGEKL